LEPEKIIKQKSGDMRKKHDGKVDTIKNFLKAEVFMADERATNTIYAAASYGPSTNFSYPLQAGGNLLLMEEVRRLPVDMRYGSFSHDVLGFIHSRWLFGISSINSRTILPVTRFDPSRSITLHRRPHRCAVGASLRVSRGTQAVLVIIVDDECFGMGMIYTCCPPSQY